MSSEQRITKEHLARKAIVYLRQSSEKQVRNNLQSHRLQYAMADQCARAAVSQRAGVPPHGG